LILKKSIRFSYEAHYSVSHEPNFREKEIWLVLHGYGQLAEFFIRKFTPFDSEDRLILAPEGTNYQYLTGFHGKVGANWMTKHERETAIANNHRFLDLLLDSFLEKYTKVPKVHVLGFSQGAATATRWASRWNGQINTLVLWAGGFAHDLILGDANLKFQDTKLMLVTGTDDTLMTQESISKQEELIQRLEKEVIRLYFSGGHEIESNLLEKIIQNEI
jgi:predicted esterase